MDKGWHLPGLSRRGKLQLPSSYIHELVVWHATLCCRIHCSLQARQLLLCREPDNIWRIVCSHHLSIFSQMLGRIAMHANTLPIWK